MMNFKVVHNNLNVFNLEKSLDFYQKALQMKEVRRMEKPNFTIVFLGDGSSVHNLELTWMKERTTPYNLGDNEIHLAFKVDDFTAAHEMHKKMNCICYENKDMGIYFIADPDGYWMEIIPLNR